MYPHFSSIFYYLESICKQDILKAMHLNTLNPYEKAFGEYKDFKNTKNENCLEKSFNSTENDKVILISPYIYLFISICCYGLFIILFI